IGLDRYFPPAFGRIHPRWGTPYVAVLVQAVFATLVLPLAAISSGSAGHGSTVEQVYIVILDAQILIYFVPFLYLFCLLLLERPADRTTRSVIPGGTAGRLITAALGLFVTAFAMVVAAVPPSDQAPI